ncbi:hypothetical protein P43SY_001852 [Pythium insidiosum]|uniref:L-ectoine synthase n=1 Tax=Pythium insidiosum TaxID=114742 RepID=A0AAD5Q9T0_PYTIN|nr:hypothetical protein P43SY_001852 [Pythium insidiosum]
MLPRLPAALKAPLRVGSRALHASRTAPFLFRSLDDVARDGRVMHLENGAVESRRYLVRGDGCGFSMQHEIFRKAQGPATLEYRNHVCAVMVTKGSGRLHFFDSHGNTVARHEHTLAEGSFFALEAAERIEIEPESEELHVISVMNPPLVGSEQRHPESGVFPVIDHDGIEREEFDHSMIRRLCEPPSSLKGGSEPMRDDPLF